MFRNILKSDDYKTFTHTEENLLNDSVERRNHLLTLSKIAGNRLILSSTTNYECQQTSSSLFFLVFRKKNIVCTTLRVSTLLTGVWIWKSKLLIIWKLRVFFYPQYCSALYPILFQQGYFRDIIKFQNWGTSIYSPPHRLRQTFKNSNCTMSHR